MISKIEEEFITISKKYYEKTGYDYWNNHVKYVVKIALELADEYKADKEIVWISAILHDIAKPLEASKDKEHSKVGAAIAEELLLKENFPSEKIEKVKQCILNHSEDVDENMLSKEEWCVRCADVISMFYDLSIFYYLAYSEYKLDFEKGKEFVKNIISNKFSKLDKKLTKRYKDIYNNIYNAI